MIRKYVLPILAVAGLIFMVAAVRAGRKPVVSTPALVTPSANPYPHALSGAGVVEPRTDNIAVAPAIGGIVEEVYVKWADRVKAGDKLFQIDARPLQAQIATQKADVALREAELAQAEADLAKAKAAPRPEDIPTVKAKLAQAKAQQASAEDQWQRIQKLAATRAVSDDELSTRRFAYEQAVAAADAAQGDLDKLLAGTWKPDLKIAEASVAAAQAAVAASKAKLDPLEVDLARLTVTAPVDGTVLRINARKGQYAASAGVTSAADAAIVIGDIQNLHVRVDIDENDAPRLVPGARATGYIRGKTDTPIPLAFIRIEPFVIPKKNLTGGATERVDTRVLQVIYAADKSPLPMYVGQQMDVFVEVPEPPAR